MKMQDILVSFFIFYIASSLLIGIGYSKKTFDVLDYGAVGDGQTDDSQAFVKAWQALCGTAEANYVPTLLVPKKKTFLLQPVKFEGPCKSKSVHVQVLGNMVAPGRLDAWKQCSSYSWLAFSSVSKLILNGSGKIDGQGSTWWSKDNKYSSFINMNRKKCIRPEALHFHQCDNLRLSGITLVNSPRAHICINQCNNVYISHLTISAPEDSPNTDGIDISNSVHVKIHDSYIGTGDDCIAMNTGSSNLTITKIKCGPGHGISVGSLGENGAYDTVEHVYVKDCSFNGTQNGVRIKTWQGGSGYARNITFEKITLNAAKNPIIIDQFYCDGGHRCRNKTSAVAVGNVRYTGFEGTSGNLEAIKLDCNQISGCQNILLEGIKITSAVPSEEVYATCNNAHGICKGTTLPAVSCLK